MCILPSSNFEQSINALLTLAQFKIIKHARKYTGLSYVFRSMYYTLMVSNFELFEHFNNR